MLDIELIGVPFDGYGRQGHQARAATALREAGLGASFGSRQIVAGPDLDLPAFNPGRAAGSGLMNEEALLAMVDAVHGRVASALVAGQFPLVYGGDCTALLGAVPALRDATGDKAGLVFIDGHEDTTPLDVSPDGEGASAELGLLLGLTGRAAAPDALRRRLPALRPESLAVLGPRDWEFRRELNVASLADRPGVFLRTHDRVAVNPAAVARDALAHVSRAVPGGWWLHTDLDVLSQAEFAAQRVPGDGDEAGGLGWAALTELVSAALAVGGCRGWSLVIYDPEQDSDGSEAVRIVRFVADVAAGLP